MLNMLNIAVTGVTHRGSKRAANEDAAAWDRDLSTGRALGVIADGMGGYEGGEIASAMAIETFTEALASTLRQSRPADIGAVLQDAVAQANRRIQAARNTDPALARMGTTLVAALVDSGVAHIAHLGDSRCYLLSEGRLELQTRDDTVVQGMLDRGEITEADVPRVPFRHILTKALGVDTDLEASIRTVPVSPGDILILCSDGVTGALPPAQWPALMARHDTLESQAWALINACLENQAEDNISLVLIQLS
jgi:serine/threonine protein phosphatase PrpC